MSSIVINFNEAPHGLIPTIVQDAETKMVLAFAYMNEESFERTKEDGILYLSQPNTQNLYPLVIGLNEENKVVDISTDENGKAFLMQVKVEQDNNQPVVQTCFGEENKIEEHFLQTLENLIYHRKNNPIATSYTNKLFDKGINKIAQKVGEEAVELVIEAKDDNADLFLGEAADLMYHYLVLLAAKNFTLNDVLSVLKQRHK